MDTKVIGDLDKSNLHRMWGKRGLGCIQGGDTMNHCPRRGIETFHNSWRERGGALG